MVPVLAVFFTFCRGDGFCPDGFSIDPVDFTRRGTWPSWLLIGSGVPSLFTTVVFASASGFDAEDGVDIGCVDRSLLSRLMCGFGVGVPVPLPLAGAVVVVVAAHQR